MPEGDSGKLTENQNRTLDSFLEKNSYIYINQNKQKVLMFFWKPASVLFSLFLIIGLIKIINFFYIKCKNFFNFHSSINYKNILNIFPEKLLNPINEFIENINEVFEKFKNFFGLKKILISLVSLFVASCGINLLSIIQIKFENSEVSNFFELNDALDYNLISFNYFF